MFNNKMVSVVMPAYDEEDYIFKAVTEFLSNPYTDEVIVVNNNSTDNTVKLAEEAGGKVIHEYNQGYGFACRRALKEANGDYIILVEPDGTFDSKDILKFLAYSEDFDFVLGTRNTRELIGEGANMGLFLKWGNYLLAKIIEFLYDSPSLSDVGCTYRLISKDALNKIENKFAVGGSHFSPEMMILALKNNIRTIEIPVNYKARKGISKITGKKWSAFLLGLVMFKTIISYLWKK